LRLSFDKLAGSSRTGGFLLATGGFSSLRILSAAIAKDEKF
jgi:hypothetical protein